MRAAPEKAGAAGWRQRMWLPLAASIVFVGVLAYEWGGGVGSADDGQVFVEDYLRRAVGEDHIDTHDPAEVTRFLERELGVRFEPIRLAGLTLTRAEICLLEGRRGAMIVYKRDGAEVSHYIIPRERTAARAPALSQPARGLAGDMPVVTWATPNVEQALVGEVDADQLLAIASRERP